MSLFKLEYFNLSNNRKPKTVLEFKACYLALTGLIMIFSHIFVFATLCIFIFCDNEIGIKSFTCLKTFNSHYLRLK